MKTPTLESVLHYVERAVEIVAITLFGALMYYVLAA